MFEPSEMVISWDLKWSVFHHAHLHLLPIIYGLASFNEQYYK